MSHRLLTFYLLIVFFCCVPLIGYAASTPTPADSTKAKAAAILDDLETYQKYVDAISPNDLTDLPVVMKKKYPAQNKTQKPIKLECLSGGKIFDWKKN